MKILLLDTETTGLEDDPKSIVIEIGYALWVKGYGVTNMANLLLHEPYAIEHGNPVEHINHISPKLLNIVGTNPKVAYDHLYDLFQKVDGVMAANFMFDKTMIKRSANYHGLQMPKATWIDFLTDIEFPSWVKGRSLIHRAADHGILNPMPHRALPDVLTMAMVLEKGQYDMEKILSAAKFPIVKCLALVSIQNKDKAKSKGFYWDASNKTWFKNVRENKVKDLVEECDFEVRI